MPFTQLGTVFYIYSSELCMSCFKLVVTSYSGLSNCSGVSLTTATIHVPHKGVFHFPSEGFGKFNPAALNQGFTYEVQGSEQNINPPASAFPTSQSPIGLTPPRRIAYYIPL